MATVSSHFCTSLEQDVFLKAKHLETHFLSHICRLLSSFYFVIHFLVLVASNSSQISFLNTFLTCFEIFNGTVVAAYFVPWTTLGTDLNKIQHPSSHEFLTAFQDYLLWKVTLEKRENFEHPENEGE